MTAAEYEALIAKAKAMIGGRYLHGGRGPDFWDCWGVVLAFLPEAPDRKATEAATLRAVALLLTEGLSTTGFFETGRPEPGCVVSMARNERITHAGIWLGDPGVLHAVDPEGVITSKLPDLTRMGYLHRRFFQWRP